VDPDLVCLVPSLYSGGHHSQRYGSISVINTDTETVLVCTPLADNVTTVPLGGRSTQSYSGKGPVRGSYGRRFLLRRRRKPALVRLPAGCVVYLEGA
jgi:hypothetical protein